MIKRMLPVAALCLLVLVVAGCDSNYITQAARANLADFVTDIFGTAIRATLTPSIY